MATSKKGGGTIKRRTGGVGHSTGKGTSLKKINKERKDWYDSKMEGTAGPYNPPKKRRRKRPATGAGQDYPTKKTPKKASAMGFTKKDVAKSKKRRTKKTVSKHGGGMSHVGLSPAEETRAGVLPETERRRFAKTGGTVKRKAGGTVKKQIGGLTQGYDARLDESLGARNRGTTGNLAARRHESEGMERALGRGPYSGAGTMAKKGGTVSRSRGGVGYKKQEKKKQTSRQRPAPGARRAKGGKIMQGYKAGGRV